MSYSSNEHLFFFYCEWLRKVNYQVVLDSFTYLVDIIFRLHQDCFLDLVLVLRVFLILFH